jgi:hypothetical protein
MGLEMHEKYTLNISQKRDVVLVNMKVNSKIFFILEKKTIKQFQECHKENIYIKGKLVIRKV